MVVRLINLSLDEELDTKLKAQSSMSGLIRELLQIHFAKETTSKMSEEEIRKRLEILRIRREAEEEIGNL